MKKILAVLLVAVFAFALSACGGDKESEETYILSASPRLVHKRANPHSGRIHG